MQKDSPAQNGIQPIFWNDSLLDDEISAKWGWNLFELYKLTKGN